jgi:hypothetical protein
MYKLTSLVCTYGAGGPTTTISGALREELAPHIRPAKPESKVDEAKRIAKEIHRKANARALIAAYDADNPCPHPKGLPCGDCGAYLRGDGAVVVPLPNKVTDAELDELATR